MYIASSEVEPVTHTPVKQGSSSVSFVLERRFRPMAISRSRIQYNVDREIHDLLELQLEGSQASRVQKKVSRREGER